RMAISYRAEIGLGIIEWDIFGQDKSLGLGLALDLGNRHSISLYNSFIDLPIFNKSSFDYDFGLLEYRYYYLVKQKRIKLFAQTGFIWTYSYIKVIQPNNTGSYEDLRRSFGGLIGTGGEFYFTNWLYFSTAISINFRDHYQEYHQEFNLANE